MGLTEERSWLEREASPEENGEEVNKGERRAGDRERSQGRGLVWRTMKATEPIEFSNLLARGGVSEREESKMT